MSSLSYYKYMSYKNSLTQEATMNLSNEGPGEAEEDEFVIRLKDGSFFSDAISGLQKSIRRGWEAEALVLALGLYDSGYGAALARRIPVVAAEDIGLAAPDVVAQACTLCATWLAIRKDQKHQPADLLLLMAVMLLCRSANKNREVDNAAEVIREEQKRGVGDMPNDVIERHHELILDSHTPRGAARLRKIAQERGIPYEQMALEQFYRSSAVLQPLTEIGGDPWSRKAYQLVGLDYDELKGGKKSEG
jgi:replication-associated recombination protein RarA